MSGLWQNKKVPKMNAPGAYTATNTNGAWTVQMPPVQQAQTNKSKVRKKQVWNIGDLVDVNRGKHKGSTGRIIAIKEKYANYTWRWDYVVQFSANNTRGYAASTLSPGTILEQADIDQAIEKLEAIYKILVEPVDRPS